MSSAVQQVWLAILIPLILGILAILLRHLFIRTRTTWRHRHR